MYIKKKKRKVKYRCCERRKKITDIEKEKCKTGKKVG